jgi:hypothetical protein
MLRIVTNCHDPTTLLNFFFFSCARVQSALRTRPQLNEKKLSKVAGSWQFVTIHHKKKVTWGQIIPLRFGVSLEKFCTRNGTRQ